MIARNFCLSFVDTQRFNVKFVGNFYIRYKTCQIAVARLIKNKTFSQVLFFLFYHLLSACSQNATKGGIFIFVLSGKVTSPLHTPKI